VERSILPIIENFCVITIESNSCLCVQYFFYLATAFTYRLTPRSVVFVLLWLKMLGRSWRSRKCSGHGWSHMGWWFP